MSHIKKWMIVLMALAGLTLAGCSAKPTPAAGLDKDQSLRLTIAGPWVESVAIDSAAVAFTKLYPNCEVVYEYVQDYDMNMPKRLEGSGVADLFITNNIQADSAYLPYAYDLLSNQSLDLSETFPGLIDNFTFGGKDGGKLYAVPMGAELRGMFINKTLLATLGLSVPQNRSELLAACETLREAGYVPLQGNPSGFAQQMMYPYIASLIANAEDYQTVYNRVNDREAGVSQLFKDPVSFLYDLTQKGYYQYKYVETELGLFTDTTNEAVARYFLNVLADDKLSGDYKKKDDVGQVAFMPSVMSRTSVIEKTKEDYNSQIDYAFILSPVSEEGGYAYLSPSQGFAVNKNSEHLDWAVAFLNYIFSKDVSQRFAELENIIPNTKTAFDVITKQFDVPANRICELGQVTFEYGFYNIIQKTLVDVSKSNNPKYMVDNGDGTYTPYPVESFMEKLEADFQAEKSVK